MKNIKEQAAHAVGRLKVMLEEASERRLTEDELRQSSTEDLITKLIALDEELRALKRKIRKARPKVTVEMAAKTILEDPETPHLNAALIAEIIRTTFHRYGHDCETSVGSIRWYITKKTQDWNIIPRRPPYEAVPASAEEESKNEAT